MRLATIMLLLALNARAAVSVTTLRAGTASVGPPANLFTLAAERRIDYAPGIPGGIITPTGGMFTNHGAGTSQTILQTSLNNCPSNQYVLLTGSNFYNATLYVHSYTALLMSNATLGASCVQFGTNNNTWNGATPTAITSGNTKGSRSIVVASAANIAVGKMLKITQTDPSWVTQTGTSGTANWVDGDLVNKSMQQIVMVTNVSGTTIGIDRPLHFGYNNSPLAYPFAVECQSAFLIGVTNAKIYAFSTGQDVNIIMNASYRCGVTNIECDFASGDHMQIFSSLQCNVQHNYFHDGFAHGPGGFDDGVWLKWSSDCLVSDNIFYRMHVSLGLEWGASGNVIAYNYSTNNYHDPFIDWMINDFLGNHGAHPSFNLFEGNAGVHFRPDSTWGSSSHTTFLRNYSAGADFYFPPENARSGSTPAAQWEESNVQAFSIDTLQVTNNLIGNIAGSTHLAGMSPTVIKTNGANAASAYRFGYNSDDDSFVASLQYTSAVFEGNYSSISTTQFWSSASKILPNSYWLTAKPAWFGNCPYPPVDPTPAAAATFSITNIPAGARFASGNYMNP